MVPMERQPRGSQGMFLSRPEVLVALPGYDYSQLSTLQHSHTNLPSVSTDTHAGSSAYGDHDDDAAADQPSSLFDDVLLFP